MTRIDLERSKRSSAELSANNPGTSFCEISKSASQCVICRGQIRPYWEEVNMWECAACRLLVRNPMPSQQQLDDLYGKSWLQPAEHVSETGSTDLTLARQYSARLLKSLGRSDFQGMTLLEFGAGQGAMMHSLAECGAEMYGIEPFGWDRLRQQGLRAYKSFEDLPVDLQFDGVVTLDVIEHLSCPENEFMQIGQRLRREGWLFVSTPNRSGLNARVSKGKWREARKPGHLVFFNPTSLQYFLRKCGFRRNRRLRWWLNYGKPPVYTVLQYAMQLGRVDGELRYLASVC